nr:unnamed protein product [Digitaria exilis]
MARAPAPAACACSGRRPLLVARCHPAQPAAPPCGSRAWAAAHQRGSDMASSRPRWGAAGAMAATRRPRLARAGVPPVPWLPLVGLASPVLGAVSAMADSCGNSYYDELELAMKPQAHNLSTYEVLISKQASMFEQSKKLSMSSPWRSAGEHKEPAIQHWHSAADASTGRPWNTATIRLVAAHRRRRLRSMGGWRDVQRGFRFGVVGEGSMIGGLRGGSGGGSRHGGVVAGGGGRQPAGRADGGGERLPWLANGGVQVQRGVIAGCGRGIPDIVEAKELLGKKGVDVGSE